MRYLILILLNTPIIFLAFLNIVTQYKLQRISRRHFYRQLALWIVILTLLIGSFPVYNLIIGRPVIDSIGLTAFDIVQTTAIIVLFYFANDQHRKIDLTERRLRDLHQELSIKLSEEKYERKTTKR